MWTVHCLMSLKVQGKGKWIKEKKRGRKEKKRENKKKERRIKSKQTIRVYFNSPVLKTFLSFISQVALKCIYSPPPWDSIFSCYFPNSPVSILKIPLRGKES